MKRFIMILFLSSILSCVFVYGVLAISLTTSGRVIDKDTNEAIEGVRIYIIPRNSEYSGQIMTAESTDNNGEYSMHISIYTNSDDTDLYLRAYKEGYVPYTADINITDNPIVMQKLLTENAGYIPDPEFNALKDFYSATHGDFWGELLLWGNELADYPWKTNRWFTTRNPSEWHGVTVEDGHITGIELGNISLYGDIPESIKDLSYLKILDLNKNCLFNLPDSIGELVNLKTLDLTGLRIDKAHSVLTEEKWGVEHRHHPQGLKELPGSITNLTNLTTLRLGTNLIEKLPEDISNLTNLIVLDISENSISELPVLPESLDNENVFVSYNCFSLDELKKIEKETDYSTQLLSPINVLATSPSGFVTITWDKVPGTLSDNWRVGYRTAGANYSFSMSNMAYQYYDFGDGPYTYTFRPYFYGVSEINLEIIVENIVSFQQDGKETTLPFPNHDYMRSVKSEPIVFCYEGRPVISGRVIDRDSHNGVPNAQIKIGDKVATTNSYGLYKIGIYPGTYEIEITCNKYFGYTGTVTISEDITKDFRITQSICSFKAWVKDSAGDPLAEVPVKIGENILITDQSGYCSMEMPRDSVHSLEIKYDGYYDYIETLYISRSTSRNIILSLKDDVPDYSNPKDKPENFPVILSEVTLVRTPDGRCFAIAKNRAWGIEVRNVPPELKGKVNLKGIITNKYTLECYVYVKNYFTIDPEAVARPFFMTNNMMGGTDFGFQKGVTGGIGPNNVGSYIKTTGKAIMVGEPLFIIISDGSSKNMIELYLYPTEFNSGCEVNDYVIVEGIVSIMDYNNIYFPRIYPIKIDVIKTESSN